MVEEGIGKETERATHGVHLGGTERSLGDSLTKVRLQQNLSAIVRQSQQAGAKVLILGMRLLPNYGQRYTTAFAEVFPKVAQDTGAALVRFMLEGVGGVASMMQADGIHPAASAQTRLLDNVWPTLKPML